MEKLTFKKNGLIYTDDFKVVVGIDADSNEFTGKVPNGATSVEEEAFSCCDLKEIFLPDSVEYLGANLFCNSTKLESVRLPANLKNLPPFLFCGCESLKKVEMPYEVQDFSEGLFAGCASLEEIPFRSGIKTLPENVFDSCSAIKSLVIPGDVTKICSNAIANCENLETIVLPEKLEIVEKDWLLNCPKLKHIRISEENPFFKTDEENCVLYKIVDGEKVPLVTLENKSEESLPGFKEPDIENSIINFDENEDETMDDTNIFNSEVEDLKDDSVLQPENSVEEEILDVSDEKTFMHNLFFETQKVLQQNTGIEGEQRILFVFAENLVSTPLGEKFSVKLQNCCSRLSKIHNFTSIYYFYDTRLDNEKFRKQFIEFFADKDVVVACEGSNLYNLTDKTLVFCRFVNISLEKEDILEEIKNSKNPEWKPLKLIIQDNLEE